MLFAARPRRAFKADVRPAKAQTAARPMRPPAVVVQAFSLPDIFGRPPGRCGILAASAAFIFAGGVSYPAGVDLSADRKNAAFFINYANASFWPRQIRLFCGPPCSFVNRVDAVPSVNRLAVPFM